MPVVYSILAGLAAAVGALGTLMFLVMALAGAPNSSPQQLTMLKIFCLVTAVVGLLCLAGSIWLNVRGHPGWSSAVGIFPMAAFLVACIWVSLK